MKRVTKKVMIYFALGQLGWSILSGLIANLLVNFYLPDATDTVMQSHLFIPQGAIFLGLTVIGLITAFGRIFDAITDPFIASKSDQCQSKLGKRIPFMRYSAIPFALVTVLVFFCPVGNISAINVIWLVVTLLLFYLCMTSYCTPYNALIPVLGKHPTDRMNISTFISITYLLGTGIAFSAKMIWMAVASATGWDIVMAARIVITCMAILATICMLIPSFGIDENEYTQEQSQTVSESMFASLQKTFSNKQFRIFVLSDISYWVGITIFNTGFIYYVENLLKTNNYMILFLLMTFVSFVLYIPVNIVTKKVGKKKMVIAGFLLFGLAFFVTTFAGKQTAIPNETFGMIIAVLVGIPLSILGVVPQAVVADIAEADEYETHENHDGMFFAARTFAFKLGQSLAMIIFTSVAVIGQYRSVTGELVSDGSGYRLSLAIALVFSLVGAIILGFYNERQVVAKIEEGHKALEKQGE